MAFGIRALAAAQMSLFINLIPFWQNVWVDELLEDQLTVTAQQRLRMCTSLRLFNSSESGNMIYSIYACSFRHCVRVWTLFAKLEIVQLWSGREEVVKVKAAAVWVCVYLGEAAVAAGYPVVMTNALRPVETCTQNWSICWENLS